MTLNEKLERLISQAGHPTHRALAAAADSSSAANIGKWLRGESKPRDKAKRNLEAYFELPPGVLDDGRDLPPERLGYTLLPTKSVLPSREKLVAMHELMVWKFNNEAYVDQLRQRIDDLERMGNEMLAEADHLKTILEDIPANIRDLLDLAQNPLDEIAAGTSSPSNIKKGK